MNIYFQFFTQNQSVEAINLIKLPALFDFMGVDSVEAKISRGGKIAGLKCNSVDALCSKLVKNRFNEVEANYSLNELKFGASVLRVKKLNGVFVPSAIGDLWFPTKDFIEDSRDSMMRKMNAELQESCLAGLGIERKPSIYEVALEIESSVSINQIVEDLAILLANILSENYTGLNIFGCCDFGGREMFVRLESNVLMLDKIRVMAKILPTVYPELGTRFDSLHPLLFGDKQVCAELAMVLGGDAKLICSHSSSNSAVIQLVYGCDISAANRRVKNLLLPTIR